MEPQVKAKIYLNKMGAQLKKIEKKVVHMEERVEVAGAFFMRTTETITAIKRELEEIKRTWASVAEQMEEIEEWRKMEESLNEEFPIDEIEEGKCYFQLFARNVHFVC